MCVCVCARVYILFNFAMCGHDVLTAAQCRPSPAHPHTTRNSTRCCTLPTMHLSCPLYPPTTCHTHLLILHLLLLWVGVIKPHDQLALERQLVVLVQERCLGMSPASGGNRTTTLPSLAPGSSTNLPPSSLLLRGTDWSGAGREEELQWRVVEVRARP